MSVLSVFLTGSAVTGHIISPEHHLAIQSLPALVKLGRKPPTARAKLAPHLGDFLDVDAAALPASTNWREKAAVVIARMYKNAELGCCVIASNIHGLGIASANDPDSGGTVQATDDEIVRQYHAICGAGDNGCVIEETLAYGMTKGWPAGGKTYKLDAYAAVDWTRWDLLRACCAYFGGFKIGINLPSAWTSNAIWDVTNTGIIGGHDVRVIDYDDQYLYLSSWGRIYKLTKAAATSSRWLEEAWITIDGTWYGPDKQAPSGFDLAGLKVAMAALHGGDVPPAPGPVHACPAGQHWDEAQQKCVADPPVPPTPQKLVAHYPGGTFPVTVAGPFGRPLQGSVTIPGATLPVVPADALDARDWSRIIQAILNGAKYLCPLVPLLATAGVPPEVVAALKLACSFVPPAPLPTTLAEWEAQWRERFLAATRPCNCP